MNQTSHDEEPSFPQELFLEWRSPRLGTANPSILTNPVWEWLIRTRMNAHQANQMFRGPSALEAGPGWCFDRFGQTATALPDGREVLIAGEHEDHYDADFFIYNDVVVKAPDGALTIYGYPPDIFPPTDFHTATLLPGSILLIGSLGYQEDRRRPRETQVLQLLLDTFAIRRIDARGPSPGWIHRHHAVLSDDGRSITISGGMIDPCDPQRALQENVDDWMLDLPTWTWTRATERRWPQWAFRRADRKHNQLWQLRLAIWMRDTQWVDRLAGIMQELEAHIGRPPDLDLLPALYRPDDSVTPLPPLEDRHNVFRVMVDGVVVRFTEEHHLVRAIVEGSLSPDRLRALQESVKARLSTLEGVPWVIEAL